MSPVVLRLACVLLALGLWGSSAQDQARTDDIAQSIIQDLLANRAAASTNLAPRIKTLQAAAVTNHNNANIFFALGIYNLLQDRLADGLKYMASAYELAPHNAQIAIQYVLALKMNKLPLKALEVDRKLAAENPDNAAIQFHLAVLETTVQDYPAALAILEPLKRHPPLSFSFRDQAILSYLLGSCYLYSGRYAEASNALNHALAIIPEMATARATLGELDLKVGDLSRAAANLDAALAANPQFPAARYYRGLCHEKTGDRSRAVKCYLQAYSDEQTGLVSDNGEDHYLLYLICQKLGKTAKANEHKDAAAALHFTFEAPWAVTP